MSLDRLISIKVDSDSAQKKLNQMLLTLKKFDKEISETGGEISSSFSKPIKSLSDFDGVITNLNRDIIKTNGAISKQESALLKYDTAVRTAQKNLIETKYTQEEYNTAIAKAKKIYDDRVTSIAKGESTQKKARTTLLDFTGVLSNEARILQQSTGNLSYAEAATLRYDTAVRKLSKSAADGKINQQALSTGLMVAEQGYKEAYKGATGLDQAMAKGRSGFRAMRGATSQLSYQLQDIAVQYQFGTNAATIFTQQFPQIASIFGPAGAIVGVIGAIAGAVAGPLITSMFEADDAAKKLEKTMESLSSTLEKGENGIYSYTKALIELNKANESSSEIKIAKAVYDAELAIKSSSKGIISSIEDIDGTLYDFFDFDGKGLSENIKLLEEAGIDLNSALSSGFRAQGFSGESRKIKGAISETRRLVSEVGDEFGLARTQSASFVSALSNINSDSTKNDFKSLHDALAGIIRNMPIEASEKQRDKFIEIASSLSEMADKGYFAAEMLEALRKNMVRGLAEEEAALRKIRNGYIEYQDARIEFETSSKKSSFSQNVIDLASLNSEYSKSSSLILQIKNEQEKLYSLKQSNAELDTEKANITSRKSIINLIAEELSKIDKISERESVLNRVRASGFSVSKSEIKEINELIKKYNGELTEQERQQKRIVNACSEIQDALREAYSGNYFSESEIAIASLTSGLNKYSSLVLEIANQQKNLKSIDYSALDMPDSDIELAQRELILKTISDEVSELDTYAKRQELINGLVKAGFDLREGETKTILDQAQKQNFVYKEQIGLLSSIGDIIKESTESTVNAANETKAWKELARQLSEVYDQGAKDYVKSVGTYNSSLQSLVTSTFKSMEDAIVSWAETGKLNFTSFVNSAISDLLRLIVQQQLAGFASSFFGGSASGISGQSSGVVSGGVASGGAKGFAKGGAVERFATGGVTGLVNTIQNTPKRFANGSGLAGEAAQSEGIFPLTRTSGGDLGVKAVGASSSPVININTVNEVGVESTQTQTQNSGGSIDINIINSLVSKSIASGNADRAILNRFNTSKRGK